MEKEAAEKISGLELRIASQDVEIAKLKEAQISMKVWITANNMGFEKMPDPISIEKVAELAARIAAQKIEIAKLSDDHTEVQKAFEEKLSKAAPPKSPVKSSAAPTGQPSAPKGQSPRSASATATGKPSPTTPPKTRNGVLAATSGASPSLVPRIINSVKKRTSTDNDSSATASPTKIPKTSTPARNGPGWIEVKTKGSPVKKISTSRGKPIVVLNRTITTHTGLKSALSMPILPPPLSLPFSTVRHSPRRAAAKPNTLSNVGLTMPIRRRHVGSPSFKKKNTRLVGSTTRTSTGSGRTSTGSTNSVVRRKSGRGSNPTIKLCYSGSARSPTLTESLSTDNIGMASKKRNQPA